jgi:type VI secretion system protein ImpA
VRYWLRARLRLDGLAALAPGLQVLTHLLTTWWDELHPRLDDGDAFARLNVLAELGSLDSLLGDVRQSWVLNNRSIGQVSVRDVELALGQLIGRDDESPTSREQLESMLRDATDADPSVATQVPEALAALDALDECLSTRVGYGERPDFSALRGMLESVQSVSPTAAGSGDESSDTDDLLSSLDDGGDSSDGDAPTSRRGRGGRGEMGSIESREDAVRAIGLVCDYLERHEPTNPAANLLRRAQRLIDRNFLQLVREFAPDAVNEVARILGVDPDSIEPSSY